MGVGYIVISAKARFIDCDIAHDIASNLWHIAQNLTLAVELRLFIIQEVISSFFFVSVETITALLRFSRKPEEFIL